jgi:hypothetical protein
MAKEADYGFMIWDAKSSGTLSNILELLERGKKGTRVFGSSKRLINLHDLDELSKLLQSCTAETIELFDNKVNLLRRIQQGTTHQIQMFFDFIVTHKRY